MAWKEYPNDKLGYTLIHGGYGPREDGRPSEWVSYHTASNLPFWDWVENEDGSWFWLGRGRYGTNDFGRGLEISKKPEPIPEPVLDPEIARILKPWSDEG